MKKADMITAIQNKEAALWNELMTYIDIDNDQHSKSSASLVKSARAKWCSVNELLNELGIETLRF